MKAFEYHEVSDGDIIIFGESTRMLIAHLDEAQDEDDIDLGENQEAQAIVVETAPHKEAKRAKDSQYKKQIK